MAKVWVQRDALERGRLPPVCAKSGSSTDRWVEVDAFESPGWAYGSLMLGAAAYLFTARLTREAITFALPMREEALERWSTLSRLAWLAVAVGVAVVLVGLVPGWGWLAGLGVIVIAIGAGLLEASRRAYVLAEIQAQRVRLHHVHPRFVEAVEQAGLSAD